MTLVYQYHGSYYYLNVYIVIEKIIQNGYVFIFLEQFVIKYLITIWHNYILGSMSQNIYRT